MSHPSESNTFRCRYAHCTATYRRKEHLNRHLASHKEERLCCPYCDATLTRRNVLRSDSKIQRLCNTKTNYLYSDLLRRHIRKLHPDMKPPTSRAVKACKACHLRKERCDGEDPCNQCQRRKVICSHPDRQESARNECTMHPTQAYTHMDLVEPALNGSSWVGQEFVDIYFDQFHPIWPFLHRGTFKVEKEPCVLVQSMLMIGLWIKGDSDARRMAMAFHDRLLSAIQTQRAQWYIAESTPHGNKDTPCHMVTYQSILLQVIFSLVVAKIETPFDLNLRCELPASNYELLTSLARTCRRLGLFYYPNMLARHEVFAPPALVWVSVEETKRFGLALYKLCRLVAPSIEHATVYKDRGDLSNELLNLGDLEFSMPDPDEVWNASVETGSHNIRASPLQGAGKNSSNPDEWISNALMKFSNSSVGFDWI
ncbi:uncharacterized protein N7496_003653 [Penicillium cataractarum]|uniref:Zn(2)-C6 fungal-type domain-containing protein n=1 Tax=Penicillium cataractarum TaxID=2100454 RepID=A0A9W9SNF5_9EURO|nr:uncharacterized protein N7496_003653 [Penicillium cataractarum]KAJ5381225.1 hypothetical protein N7496_003653 [Penicillium cataractarum]